MQNLHVNGSMSPPEVCVFPAQGLKIARAMYKQMRAYIKSLKEEKEVEREREKSTVRLMNE